MHKPAAIIIMRDTLRALGVKHLLATLLDARTVVTPSVPEQIDRYDMVFVDKAACLAHLDQFLARKSRVVVVASEPLPSWQCIDSCADEATIIDAIAAISKQLRRSSPEQQGLSGREVEVIRLVAQGMTNKEIADTLNISINTVLSHRKNISAKLGIKSVSALSIYAMMNGIA